MLKIKKRARIKSFKEKNIMLSIKNINSCIKEIEINLNNYEI